MTRKLRFINDPGHGWLEVDKKDLLLLGINKDISSYSYQKGGKAYLEEDCDAHVFITAAENAGIRLEINDINLDHSHYRSYNQKNMSRNSAQSL